MRKIFFLLLGLSIGLMSCSKVVVEKFNAKTYEEGIRFYRPAPYLLVTQTEDNGLTSTIVWLPDMNQEYVLRSTGWWGSSEVSVKLQDGWNLTEIGEKSDSKIPETITSIAGGISAATKTKFVAERLTPGLYRFVFNKEGQVESLQSVNVK